VISADAAQRVVKKLVDIIEYFQLNLEIKILRTYLSGRRIRNGLTFPKGRI
jgi:hypothetical protein